MNNPKIAMPKLDEIIIKILYAKILTDMDMTMHIGFK
jgi:hypothetical protein